AASRDGTLWARGHHNRVQVRQVEGKKLLSPPDDHYVPAHAVAITPDGRTLLTEEGNQVRLWDVPGRKALHAVKGEFGGPWGYTSTAAFRPGGKTALVVGHQHRFHEIDVPTGKFLDPIQVGGSTNQPHNFALSPDGTTLAQSYSNGHGNAGNQLTLYEM